MRYLAVIIASALLGACGTPAIQTRIQDRIVEVQKPCPVQIPERPAPLTQEDLASNAVDTALILTARLLEWQGPGGYGDRANSALEICTSNSQSRTPPE